MSNGEPAAVLGVVHCLIAQSGSEGRRGDWTVTRERRASKLRRLETLWINTRINTGTVCNITCRNCYIGSSPSNDQLAFITATEVAAYFDEIEAGKFGTRQIGFTGGEPFVNPELPAMLENALLRGYGCWY